MANRWTIAVGLCVVAGCMGPRINCQRFERIDFPVGSACLPETVAANTPLDFVVYHSCDDCEESRDFECSITVDGADLYVVATREGRFERMFCTTICLPTAGVCTLPGLATGTYTIHFDDSFSDVAWFATIDAGPSIGTPICVCSPFGLAGGCCPNTCGT